MTSKPNLFIVGAPKCGTTAWVEYLRGHGDIFFSPIKEPQHFSTDLPNRVRIASREEYLRLFRESGSAKVLGEASVRYLHSEVAAENIREFNRDARIIIFLRDHADYLVSWHSQRLYNGSETVCDFEEAWRTCGRGREADGAGTFDYRNDAEFSPKVERYFAEFPAEHIRVFHYRDWTRYPRETYLEILRFLDLEDDGRAQFPIINEAKHRRIDFHVRIVRTVRNRPGVIMAGVSMLKKLTGRQGFGIATWLVRLGTQKGRVSGAPEALKDEIRTYYRSDSALLEPRFWKGARQGSIGAMYPVSTDGSQGLAQAESDR